jgi:hypothetical protein
MYLLKPRISHLDADKLISFNFLLLTALAVLAGLIIS